VTTRAGRPASVLPGVALVLALVLALGLVASATADTAATSATTAPSTGADQAYGPELQGFDYPWPVQHYRFSSQGVALDMAYIDVMPARPNGRCCTT